MPFSTCSSFGPTPEITFRSSAFAVLARAAWQVALGLLTGIICTMIWDAVLFSRVNLRFAQPDVLVPVAVILMLVMLVACALPALRAARLDPGSVLRGE